MMKESAKDIKQVPLPEWSCDVACCCAEEPIAPNWEEPPNAAADGGRPGKSPEPATPWATPAKPMVSLG